MKAILACFFVFINELLLVTLWVKTIFAGQVVGPGRLIKKNLPKAIAREVDTMIVCLLKQEN